jgi:hypothetical protein
VIESAASLDPINLIVGESVSGGNREGLSGRFRDVESHLRVLFASENGIQAVGLDGVLSGDARIVVLVREPEREDPLFLCKRGGGLLAGVGA